MGSLNKLQEKWIFVSNNLQLRVSPSPLQVEQVLNFCGREDIFAKFMQTIQILRFPKGELIVTEQKSKLYNIIQEIMECGWVIVEIINEYQSSFKGYISWIVLINEKGTYLVNSGHLHDYLEVPLRKICQDSDILKIFLNSGPQLNSLKRDYSIFCRNIFDVNPMIWYGEDKFQTSIHPYVAHRPLHKDLYHSITTQIKTIWNLIYYIPQYLITNHDLILHTYHQSNHQDYLLSHYQHSEFHQYYSSDSDNFSDLQYKIFTALLEWRSHTAKISDVSIEQIIPYTIILEIINKNARSIIQLTEILNQQNHALSMDSCTKIIHLIHLVEQQYTSYFQLPRRSGSSTGKMCKEDKTHVKALLMEIGWEDKDWLNRKKDESIKLYKQIISIDELDESVVEEHIEGVTDTILKKHQIDRYIRYAQYLRNGNYQKLKDYYKSHPECHIDENDQEMWVFDPQESDPSIFNEQNLKGNTSLQLIEENENGQKCSELEASEGTETTLRKIGSQNKLPKAQEIIRSIEIKKEQKKGKQNSRQTIKDLPENIGQIYLMAAQVKRNQLPIQKNKKKTEKKQQIKMQEFVPSIDHLLKLFHI